MILAVIEALMRISGKRAMGAVLAIRPYLVDPDGEYGSEWHQWEMGLNAIADRRYSSGKG